MTLFTKQALTIDEQIKKLQAQGLVISNVQRARQYLQTIGYYRLSAYFLLYQRDDSTFFPDASFDDGLNLYLFDKQVRLLVMDALERIEVAVRTIVSNEMSLQYGAHWFMDTKSFCPAYSSAIIKNSKTGFDLLQEEIRDCAGYKARGKTHIACVTYYAEYTAPSLPPSWIVTETLTMGVWSRVFNSLQGKSKKRIAKFFGLSVNDMVSWLHGMTVFRNCVAHHSRFWNTSFPPKAKNVEKYTHTGIPINTPYANLAMIYATLKRISPSSSWSRRLYELVQQCPVDPYDPEHMAFPTTWSTLPFWQIPQWY